MNPKYIKFDTLFAYNIKLIEINNVFAIKIYNKYNNDLAWKKTKQILKANRNLKTNTMDLFLKLIYFSCLYYYFDY